MVLSTEIPKAILKTRIVEGLSGIPANPIIPAVINRGTILGIREIIIILKDLNIYAINSEINKIASAREITRFLTKNLVPFKNIRDLPVKFTLYLSFGNISLISLISSFSISSILIVLISFMNVEILAILFSLSTKLLVKLFSLSGL